MTAATNNNGTGVSTSVQWNAKRMTGIQLNKRCILYTKTHIALSLTQSHHQ